VTCMISDNDFIREYEEQISLNHVYTM